MPILDDQFFLNNDFDPDAIPRAVIALGITLSSNGIDLAPQRHRKGQLVMQMRGVLTCEVEGGLWLVPPHCAIWIPGGATHAIRASGTIEGYDVFIEPAASPDLPTGCCTLAVTPLLRELLFRAAGFPLLYPEGGAESHVFTLLLDEIAAAPVEQLYLPMPGDARLRRIVEMMMANPSDRGTMDIWARRAGLSERTLARLVAREAGMSFGRWHQRLMVMLSLQWLATGASIQRVADDLGYESAGSFITMFRKALGTSPGRYMARSRGSGAT